MGIEKVASEIKLSENSLRVLERRYLKKDENGKAIEFPADLFYRVAENIAQIDKNYGKSDEEIKKTTELFYSVIAGLEFLPNSPTLMNAGRELQQLSACFVLPVEDSIESIFNAARDGAIVHKSGGGTGYSFSKLRPKGDIVKTTSGIASGPVSFMYAFNVYTDIVKQGGTRRGANMGILRVDHPDIEEFISAKSEPDDKNKEILNKLKEKLGIDEQHPYFQAFKKTLIENTQLQNFNISVALTQDFMHAVENSKSYKLINPHSKKIARKIDATGLFSKICEFAWKNGEPGVIFLDRINEANPTPALGEIESTNPCVVGSSLIPTEKGLLRMNDIAKNYPFGGVSILTDNRIVDSRLLLLGAQLRSISGAWKSGAKETFKLISKSGFEIIATADHKIMTVEGWKELKNITINDRILIQSGNGFFNTQDSFGIISDYANKWTRELGQSLGWLVGDGWLREGKNCRAGFTFSADDFAVLQYLKPILNKIYGKEIKEIKRENGVYHLSYHSKKFVEFFKKLGVKPVRAGDKTVPESIFMATKEVITGFLQGLFTADGTIATNNKKNTNYIRLTSKSEELLKGVQLLLLNLGIFSKIYERHRNRRLTFRYKTIRGEIRLYESDGILYELQISKDMIPKFLLEVGFLCNKHADKIKHLKKIKFYKTIFEDRVITIEPNGLEEVYDLSEEVTHSFIANGIVVHNCGEQPLLPYESCNLGSINLSKFIKNKKIDYKGLERVVKTAVHFLDNVIDANKYPIEQIEKITRGNRKIGLGVMGFADMLLKLKVPYNSEEALNLAEEIMKFIDDTSKQASVELASERGLFPNFNDSIYDSASKHFKGKEIKLRNATVTTIAPTGSISMIADCSSGIEPLFALTYTKTVMNGTKLTYINENLEEILKEEGLYSEDLIQKISTKGIDEAEIPEYIKKVFVTAHDISPEWHVKMQAAFQKYTDNAVSKTINFPFEAAKKDVEEAYLLAYKYGCKGITIYRDRSRDTQVMEKIEKKVATGKRPKELIGITRRERVGQDKTIYVTKNYIADDETERIIELLKRKEPFEIFVNAGFFDADLYSAMTSFAKRASKDLQKGIPVEEIANDLENLPGNEMGFDEGFNGRGYANPSIQEGIRKVLVDFKPKKPKENSKEDKKTEKKGLCPECSTFNLVHQEGCDICESCGYSGKCS